MDAIKLGHPSRKDFMCLFGILLELQGKCIVAPEGFLRFGFHHQKPIDRLAEIAPRDMADIRPRFRCIGLHVRQLPLGATREHYQHDIHACARRPTDFVGLMLVASLSLPSNPLNVPLSTSTKTPSKPLFSFPLCFYRK